MIKKSRFFNFFTVLAVMVMFGTASYGQLAASIFTWDGFDGSISTLPPTVSALGFDTNRTDLFIPYEVNVPQYRNYSGMNRYVYVPAGQKITPDDSLFYTFPKGTVLFRLVYFDGIYKDPSSRRMIELQIQVRATDSTWGRLVYVYNDEGTDAKILTDDPMDYYDTYYNLDLNGTDLGYTTEGAATPTPAPSISINYLRQIYDCGSCHWNNSANGFITQQLNVGTQLADLVDKQVLASAPDIAAMDAAGKITKWHTLDDATATVAQKAHSYLAANCSHCHSGMPERLMSGIKNSYRYFTKETTPSFVNSVLMPGNPDSSEILLKMRGKIMPYAEVDVVDITAVKAIWDWANELGATNTPYPYPLIDVVKTETPAAHKLQQRIQLSNHTLSIEHIENYSIESVKLFSLLGREIELQKVTHGKYIVKKKLYPGLYFVKINGNTLRTRYFSF
ncbi:MAG: T9SS type A sorting domain-containing protein [Fibrobacteria bacterium]|nr:T9SS type A sorting domain-containing protein [Fibrobacteria bacterium]